MSEVQASSSSSKTPLRKAASSKPLLDYNSRLKPRKQKGKCGDPERTVSDEELDQLVIKLADVVEMSKHVVAFTGAGVSTSCGILDFRGPSGVWTRELRGTPLSNEEKTTEIFDNAVPGPTHRILASFMERGLLQHVVSQNVDGLHLRSGIPRENMSELHGNIFQEICTACGEVYLRESDVGGMGLALTGNKCDNKKCKGLLRDNAVDWDTSLPEDVFKIARRELRKADCVLCLGTSLRMFPAASMPLAVKRKNSFRDKPGKLCIVNLQETKYDKQANLLIRHYTDFVFEKLDAELKRRESVSLQPPQKKSKVEK